MTGVTILLDEHVGRIFERLLRERGYQVEQAKDQFGEHTEDATDEDDGPPYSGLDEDTAAKCGLWLE